MTVPIGPPAAAVPPAPSRAVLLEGDCLRLLPALPPRSVDLVLTDLPYGTTRNAWDSVVPLHALWVHLEDALRPRGVVVLTGHGLFSALLMLSGQDRFRYKYVWVKSKPTNFLNAKRQPLRKHEDVLVFYDKTPTYHPQMVPGAPYDKGVRKAQQTGSYGDFAPVRVRSDGDRFPTDVLSFPTAESEGPVWHPTQKPVALGRWLVRTYTNPGDVVLDATFGSGSFLVAAAAEGRHAIGIEKNEDARAFRKEPVDLVAVAAERLRGVGVEPVVVRGAGWETTTEAVGRLLRSASV